MSGLHTKVQPLLGALSKCTRASVTAIRLLSLTHSLALAFKRIVPVNRESNTVSARLVNYQRFYSFSKYTSSSGGLLLGEIVNAVVRLEMM